MFFIYNDKKYYGEKAVEIVRAIEHDAAGYSGGRDGRIRDFLSWSLARLADRIPLRELNVSPNLSDEMLAYDFLCLLDSYEIGNFFDSSGAPPSSSAARPPSAFQNEQDESGSRINRLRKNRNR